MGQIKKQIQIVVLDDELSLIGMIWAIIFHNWLLFEVGAEIQKYFRMKSFKSVLEINCNLYKNDKRKTIYLGQQLNAHTTLQIRFDSNTHQLELFQ